MIMRMTIKLVSIGIISMISLSPLGCGGSGATCYSCTSARLIPPGVSNVCGTELLNYHEELGYNCVKE